MFSTYNIISGNGSFQLGLFSYVRDERSLIGQITTNQTRNSFSLSTFTPRLEICLLLSLFDVYNLKAERKVLLVCYVLHFPAFSDMVIDIVTPSEQS